MDKLEFIFIIIELIIVTIEISLEIYQIISNKKMEKDIKKIKIKMKKLI